MEITVAIIALCIAMWQLKLQRDEIRMNSRINALIHTASLLKSKIEHHERIIEGLKEKGAEWAGHAARVNHDIRPCLDTVNARLIDAVSHHVDEKDALKIRKVLGIAAGNWRND